ncbi:MAG: flagellar biosynthetic protein FliR [Pirellulaceae bacterium]|nr:flagellar biosynthetic protein FliR [Pirellulaceae bacterium]
MQQFTGFMYILLRVSGLLMTAPAGWSGGAVPMKIRAFLAIGLSFVIAPVYWKDEVTEPATLVDMSLLLANELLLGLLLGLGISFLISGLQTTGQVIGQMSGLILADAFDPTSGGTVSIFSQLLNQIALAIFLIIGGHLALIKALLETFTWLPPGETVFKTSLVESLNQVVAHSFALGLQIAAPIIIALMLSLVILGLISRTLPQLNILAVGFSLNVFVMTGALFLSLPVLMTIFTDQFIPTIDFLSEELRRHYLSEEGG